MKKIILTFALFLFFGFIKTEANGLYDRDYDNYFYAELSPYGEWIEIDYDLVVWRPRHVAYNWKPYLYGRWSWTSYGWYWDSYEPFGWAVYHYGRWFYDDYYGWVWVPGDEWGPAWVEWRYSTDYIGWAPLPPYARYRPGFGIRFTIRWNSGPNYWHFVRYNSFCHAEVHHYVVHNNAKIYNKTKHRTNYYDNGGRVVNRGVSRDYIEYRTGTTIRKREIKRTASVGDYTKTRKVNSERITSYRPGEAEIAKTRSVEKNIKRDYGRTSIKSNKVVTNRSAVKSVDKTNVQRSVTKQSKENNVNRKNQSKESRTVTKKSYSKNYSGFSTDNRVEKKSNGTSNQSSITKKYSGPDNSTSTRKSVSSSKRSSKENSISSSRNSKSGSKSSRSVTKQKNSRKR
ncbi:MAG: hypothetical protein PVH88_11090 [Ignavibacteria bacterium]|jgi:hypothetical protein